MWSNNIALRGRWSKPEVFLGLIFLPQNFGGAMCCFQVWGWWWQHLIRHMLTFHSCKIPCQSSTIPLLIAMMISTNKMNLKSCQVLIWVNEPLGHEKSPEWNSCPRAHLLKSSSYYIVDSFYLSRSSLQWGVICHHGVPDDFILLLHFSTVQKFFLYILSSILFSSTNCLNFYLTKSFYFLHMIRLFATRYTRH